LPPEHPLLLGSNQSLVPVRELALEADVVLAIGTELGETDYDVVFDGNFKIGGELIRIDIDPQQLMRNHAPSIAIHSDAHGHARLLELLPAGVQPAPTARRARPRVRARLAEDFSGWAHYAGCSRRSSRCCGGPLRRRLDADRVQRQPPGTGRRPPLVQRLHRLRHLGYGLPAAIGAAQRTAPPGDQPDGRQACSSPCPSWPARWKPRSASSCCCGTTLRPWRDQAQHEPRSPRWVWISTPDFLAIARGSAAPPSAPATTRTCGNCCAMRRRTARCSSK
jgi:hypothetical protein